MYVSLTSPIFAQACSGKGFFFIRVQCYPSFFSLAPDIVPGGSKLFRESKMRANR